MFPPTSLVEDDGDRIRAPADGRGSLHLIDGRSDPSLLSNCGVGQPRSWHA
jgi:hypothetical protein